MSLNKTAGTKKRVIWKVGSAGLTALAVVATHRLLASAWRAVHGKPPPKGPADQKVSWGTALTWAAAGGVGVAVSRLIVLRLSARVWEAATHESPPETTYPV
jgi:hypothetical protein